MTTPSPREPDAREALADKIAQIDREFEREEHDAGYRAFVLIRRIWPDLKAAILRQPAAPGGEPVAYKPITMQEVRLVCGEGRLPAWAVLDACNTIARQRTALASPPASDERAKVVEDHLLAEFFSHAAIDEAMQDSWNDICSDTGCHPLDITHGKNKHLIFSPNHWANQIAKRLFVRAVKILLSKDAAAAEKGR